MFAPIGVQNIAFPESSSLSTMDFIPQSFSAFESYATIPTSSLFTTQSIETSFNSVLRCGMGPNGRVLCVPEGGGTSLLWNTETNTSQSISVGNTGGFVRNVLWDNVTNSWIVCGGSNFVKVNCDTLTQTNVPVPAGQAGSQYASVVVFGGRAYAMPLVSVTTGTRVGIFDLVNNTSTLSANSVGVTGAPWGAVLTSVGTIYFVREVGSATTIYEYNPMTDTGTNFGNFGSGLNTGYGVVNLPNGNVFIAPLSTSTTYQNLNCFIINPVNKSIQTLTAPGFGYNTGICVGQSGIVYGIRSESTGTSTGLYGFNPATNLGFRTDYPVQRPSAGGRGFQDFFSLSDGRLIAMPGQNNSGRIVYYSYLANPNNNTFPSIGVVNPIMTNGKGQ